MARDRQRAKQRQAERRARRQAQGMGTPPDVPGIDDPRAVNPIPGVFPDVAVGAPPEDTGHSASAGRDEPDLDRDDLDLDPETERELEAEAIGEIEDRELEPSDGSEPAEDYAPVGRRADPNAPAQVKDRPRVVQFMSASWAELQRVQWPDRQALTTLTGVVLGFVLIAGGYLGLLDAVFSRIINAIL